MLNLHLAGAKLGRKNPEHIDTEDKQKEQDPGKARSLDLLARGIRAAHDLEL